MKKFVLLVALGVMLLTGVTVRSHAQFFSWGQDPASIRWRQIHTENFQLIFPEDYQEQAAYLADLLEYVYGPGSESLGHRPRKVSVIIHNQTVVPNGFVSWAPARLEMFTNPPADNDLSDWLEGLSVHEFRHVVQIDKLNAGVARILSLLLGQQAAGIMTGLFYPLWFLEGDAVVAETALTAGGRGRIPAFEQGLRAQVLERGIYSFDKATLGSLRDHVPNHYELGYQLVAGSRIRYGPELWDRVTENIARRPHTITPLSNGLKRYTGLNQRQLYRETLRGLENKWTDQLNAHDYTEHVFVSPETRLFTSYRELFFTSDSTFLALRTGLADIPQMVEVDLSGRERVIFTPGFYQTPFFSTNGRLVAWAELRTDPRWEHRSWSEIHVYDLEAGKKRKLTRNSRYFAPSVSPDGSRIAVTEASSGNQYAIVLMDARTGLEEKRFTTPGNDFLMTPAWHADGRQLFAVALDEEGKRIIGIDTDTGAFITLFHAGHTEISRPLYLEPGKILITAAFSGVDNVYCLDLQSGQVEKIVSSRFGAVGATVSADGKRLLWSEYTSNGYRAAIADYPSDGTVPLDRVENHAVNMADELAAQEDLVVKRSQIPRHEYLALPYYKIPNLFHFHSWGPFSLDVDNLGVAPGVSLMSQNMLSTSVASVGYEYDLNEELGKFYLQYSYYGLYPVLDIRAETGLQRSFFQRGDSDPEPFLWREKTFRFGASLPLSFRRGPVFFGLTPTVRTSRIQAVSADESPSFFQANRMQTMEYRLTAFWQRRSVPRDIRPSWGQSADLQFRHTPFGGADMGWVFAGRMNFLFPGLARHHSLRFSAAYQKRQAGERLSNTINYAFPGLVGYPRGITGERDDRAVILTADYTLPLMHPDWNIPGIFFLKRLSATLFYDHAFLKNTEQTSGNAPVTTSRELSTYGVELMGRVHFLRFFAPVDIGTRMSYRPDKDKLRFELLTSINL
mgnify:CR=1 FL=1